MRVRVLYTNGTTSYDFYWLFHTGTDVYCGSPYRKSKRSYHRSGKVHTTTNGAREHEHWHTELRELRGQFHLETTSFVNSESWFAEKVKLQEYGGGKSDAVLVIDSRSLPPSTWVHAAVGLVEPGRGDLVSSFALAAKQAGLECHQILLATSVTPWVYVVVNCGSLAPDEGQ